MPDLDDQEREALAKGCREWEDRHTEACPATREFVEFLGEWMWTAALAARGDTFTRREVDEIAGLCRHMGYESAEAIVQLREEGRLSFAAHEEPALTHGRHCACSACAQEDWTNPKLAACGMHGPSCPAVYAPLNEHGIPETLPHETAADD